MVRLAPYLDLHEHSSMTTNVVAMPLSFAWFVALCQRVEGQKSATQAKALIEVMRPLPSEVVPIVIAMLLPDRHARAVPSSVVAHVCGTPLACAPPHNYPTCSYIGIKRLSKLIRF